jgi:thioester reductase-like protein
MASSRVDAPLQTPFFTESFSFDSEMYSMGYLFVTGATGLLGRYLLKDLIESNMSLAVLVRSGRRATAAQRVECAMAYWEEKLGRSLPRPVVLEGDITEPDLGLDARSLRWIAENCDALLHNAASLTFESTSANSEPWRSNVQGTRHVLELCRSAGIKKFHHVSTAYVCGQRQGRILESELDEGQELSNDYERSKIQAEKMVRSSDFLEELTVYRPAIIIGDSQSGYTTTYHGFYAPLQVCHTIVRAQTPNETGWFPANARFALFGHESKNLVPVDWVSAVMSWIISNPSLHGKTYHLTPQHPVTIRLVGDVLEAAAGYYGTKLEGPNQDVSGLTEHEVMFRNFISVYNSYWKDDPTFDFSNTRHAAPHLPCPHVDRAMLLKLADYAVKSNFASPRDRPIEFACDLAAMLEPLLEAGAEADDETWRLGVRVTGQGGGDWSLLLSPEALTAAELGLHPQARAWVECEIDTIAALIAGQLTPQQAIASNQIVLHGDSTARHAAELALRHLCEFCQVRVEA